MKSKLPQTETSIFAVMSGLAHKHNAINLSQGFPDFKVSQELIDLIYSNMNKGNNQYAPMPGVLNLRISIANKIEKLYGLQVNPESEITITAGATQALFTVITAFIGQGDEAIIFEPAYDSYAPAVKLNGGIPKYISLSKPEFKIDWNEVEDLISDKTKMLIINTPNNPGGFVFEESDMLRLEEITRDKDIVIISDEVYEHIIFDGFTHQSALKFPDLYQRTVAVFSFGKTFHATGWKMGYVIAPEYLMIEIRKVHQFNVFCVNTPIQYALSEYLKNENNYLNLPSFYQQKRDFFVSKIPNSRFKVIPTHGTYFQLLDYSAISDKPEFEFAHWLTKEKGLASIPVSSFYHDKKNQQILRFAFPKEEETLEKAAKILNSI
ncbi:MAG TPA: aminotransferase class I/II-fold pyridoxal phosphate-dependent enzyme [Lutibacter sp.]|nr:aminotransferase class I/II-fold pyridoxal phosphate-dependent enzyme [Lutibacter sp.]